MNSKHDSGRSRVAWRSIAVGGAALLVAGIGVAAATACETGTTLSANVTINGSWTTTYGWTIQKTATPAQVEMFTGDAADVAYTVRLIRDGGSRSAALNGNVCVKNTGDEATQNLAIAADLSRSGQPLGTTAVDVSSAPVIQPNATRCYPISINVANPVNGATYRVTARITIKNYWGHVGTPWGINPSGQTTLNEVVKNGTVHVTDTMQPGWVGTFTNSGQVSYTHAFTCDADEGTHTNVAEISETKQTASADVTIKCSKLQVTKTAQTSLRRRYTWTIAKKADASTLTLAPGATAPVAYDVTVDATPADSGHAVAGQITVQNPAGVEAVLNGVTDVVSGAGAAPVDCKVSFPYTLKAGASLTCDYATTLADAAARTNTATATLQNHTYAWTDKGVVITDLGTTADFIGTAAVDFTAAKVTLVDATADITDSVQGVLGTLTADGTGALHHVYGYTRLFGPYACGTGEAVPNTATFLTRDTRATGSASWTVTANATACATPPGTLATPSGTPSTAPAVTPATTPRKPRTRPALRVTKVGPARAVAGQQATYLITVRNTGRAAATNVVLADILPPGMTVTQRTRMAGGNPTWRIGTLAAGASRTVRVQLRIDTQAAGRRCNVARATASNAATARAQACTRVSPIASAVQPAVTVWVISLMVIW